MPFGTITILSVVAAQIASAGISYLRSDKVQEQVRLLQKEHDEAMLHRNFERAAEKRRLMLQIREQNEWSAHQFRLAEIKQNFHNTLEVKAMEKALAAWPLTVYPFVMKDKSIGAQMVNGDVMSHNPIVMHCILSKSNDRNFNTKVFSVLENRLSQVIYKHWGATSTHQIMFYSGALKGNDELGAKVYNVKEQLKDLPVLVITPVIAPDANSREHDVNFYFKVSLWGITNTEGVDNTNSMNMRFSPENISFKEYRQHKMTYTKSEINAIVEEQVAALELFIGYVADMYYWSYYRIPVCLPTLSSNSTLLRKYYKKQYLQLCNNNQENSTSCDVVEKIRLLKSIKPLVATNESDGIIENLLENIASSRGVNTKGKTLSEVLLDEKISNDIELLSTVHKCYNQKLSDSIADYIHNKKKELNDRKMYCKRCNINDFDRREYIEEHVEELDLIYIICMFEEYIRNHKYILHNTPVSLLIINDRYSLIKVHVCDSNTNEIISLSESFNYKYSFKKIKRLKNVKLLFKNKPKGEIICRLERIEKLKKLLSNDMLIY